MNANHIKILLLVVLSGFAFQARSANEIDSLNVYVFLSETCPICQSSSIELRRIYEQYSGEPIKFIAVFPNASSSAETISRFVKKYKLPWLVLKDDDRELTRKLCADTTPEVIVINQHSGETIYRGLIDNSYVTIGKRRQVVTAHYLSDAIKSYLSNEPILISSTIPVGCFIQNQVPK